MKHEARGTKHEAQSTKLEARGMKHEGCRTPKMQSTKQSNEKPIHVLKLKTCCQNFVLGFIFCPYNEILE
jgi:hypothetical protein